MCIAVIRPDPHGRGFFWAAGRLKKRLTGHRGFGTIFVFLVQRTEGRQSTGGRGRRTYVSLSFVFCLPFIFM